jgi:hypothetical protein
LLWLRREGCFAGSQYHCPEFARRVQQVEIAVHLFPSHFSYLATPDAEARIQQLWTNIGLNFPAARTVAFTEVQMTPNRAMVIQESSMQMYGIITRAAPSDITVTFCFHIYESDTTRKKTRNLYWLPFAPNYDQQESSVPEVFKIYQENWTTDRVLMAPKNFSGPAGSVQKYDWNCMLLDNKRKGLSHLRRRVVAEIHFGPLPRPSLRCPYCWQRFTAADDWMQHTETTRHDIRRGGHPDLSIYLPIPGIPADIKAALWKLELESRQDSTEHRKMHKTLEMEWGKGMR